jgi:tryptophan synthase alpha chain
VTTTTRSTGAAAISAAFERAQAEGRCALVTYVTTGWPSPEATHGVVLALQAGGADVIVLGVPFSDPVADGPAVQRAGHAALQAGVTPRSCPETVAQLRADGLTAPVLLTSYANPIVAFGLEEWVDACAAAGVEGLIVPDLPPEEAQPLQCACEQRELALVYCTSPTTPPERVARIASQTQGFLYVQSPLDVRNAAATVTDALRHQLATARQCGRTPIAVEADAARPEEARALAPLADGIIVGSAVVEKAAEGPAALRAYVASLRGAMSR